MLHSLRSQVARRAPPSSSTTSSSSYSPLQSLVTWLTSIRRIQTPSSSSSPAPASPSPSPSPSEAASDLRLIYLRPTWRLTAAGVAAFANALGGAGIGAYIGHKAQSNPDPAKRGWLMGIGLFVGLLVPAFSLPTWNLFSKGYATRLVLERAEQQLRVTTVSPPAPPPLTLLTDGLLARDSTRDGRPAGASGGPTQ